MPVILLILLAVAAAGQTPTPKLPALDARSYDFTRVNGSSGNSSVSGNLAASGSGKVLTFTSCPSGLQVGNQVRISGGTGTAEAATITAVSCNYPNNGTVTITTANSHTGAWHVTSATGGIDEALVSAGAGGAVFLAAATFDTYGTIHMSKGYAMTGVGPQASKIVPHFTTLDAVAVSSSGVEGFVTLSGFSVDFPSNQTLGSAISITNKDKAFVNNLFIRNPFVGIDFSASGGTVIITMNDVQIGGTVGARGIRATGGIGHGLFIDGLIVSGIAANQIGLDLGAVNSGSVIKNCSFQGGADSIRVDPGTQYANETTISNCIFDSYTEAGLKMTGSAPGSGTGWTVSNIRAAGVGGANVGFDIGSIYQQVNISNVTGGGVGGGLVCRGCQNLNVGPNFTWSGDGTGTAANIAIDIQPEAGTPTNGVVIHGSTLGFSDAGSTTGNTATIGIRIGAAVHTGLRLEGNRVYGSGAVLQDGNGGTGRYEHNVGIDDVIANLASAASVTVPNGYRVFNLTGTTSINNILPGSGNWVGRFVDIVKFDAGDVNFTTSGNVVSAVTVSQYGSVRFVYDGTYWHPTGGNSFPVADNITLFKNFTDNTKLAKFDLSGIGSGSTRTFAFPNASGTLPILGLAQTWSATQTFSDIIANSVTVATSYGINSSGQGFLKDLTISPAGGNIDQVGTLKARTSVKTYDSTGSTVLAEMTNAGYGQIVTYDSLGNYITLHNNSGVNVASGKAFSVGGSSGLTSTLTVRNSAGTGTCTISVVGGIITGSTC